MAGVSTVTVVAGFIAKITRRCLRGRYRVCGLWHVIELGTYGFVFLMLSRSLAAETSRYGTPLELKEYIAVLEFLATQCKGNHESIQTWSGSCEFDTFNFVKGKNISLKENREVADIWSEESLSDEVLSSLQSIARGNTGRHWIMSHGTAQFAVDAVRDRYFVAHLPEGRTDFWDPATRSYATQRLSRPPIYSILSLESASEFSPGVKYGAVAGFPGSDSLPLSQMIVIRTPAEGKRLLDFVDVRDCFAIGSVTASSPDRWYWSRLKMYLSALKGDLTQSMRESTEKNLRIYFTKEETQSYHLVFGSIEGTHTVTTFSGDAGFNVTKYAQVKQNEVGYERATSYLDNGGIFVPQSLRCFQAILTNSDDNRGVYLHEWAIKTLTLNTPLPDSQFELSQFNLGYLDKIYDQLALKLSVIDEDGVPVDIDDFRIKSTPENIEQNPINLRNRNLFLANMVVVVFAIVGYVFYFRRSSRSDGN